MLRTLKKIFGENFSVNTSFGAAKDALFAEIIFSGKVEKKNIKDIPWGTVMYLGVQKEKIIEIEKLFNQLKYAKEAKQNEIKAKIELLKIENDKDIEKFANEINEYLHNNGISIKNHEKEFDIAEEMSFEDKLLQALQKGESQDDLKKDFFQYIDNITENEDNKKNITADDIAKNYKDMPDTARKRVEEIRHNFHARYNEITSYEKDKVAMIQEVLTEAKTTMPETEYKAMLDKVIDTEIKNKGEAGKQFMSSVLFPSVHPEHKTLDSESRLKIKAKENIISWVGEKIANTTGSDRKEIEGIIKNFDKSQNNKTYSFQEGVDKFKTTLSAKTKGLLYKAGITVFILGAACVAAFIFSTPQERDMAFNNKQLQEIEKVDFLHVDKYDSRHEKEIDNRNEQNEIKNEVRER